MLRPLLLGALLCCGACAPLHRTRVAAVRDTQTRDTTLSRLVRTEFERRSGTLRQTVAEFDPPDEAARRAADSLGTTPRGPLRRITRTTVELHGDRTARADSLVGRGSTRILRSDERSTSEERPSDGTLRLRAAAWIAAAVALLLLSLRRLRR